MTTFRSCTLRDLIDALEDAAVSYGDGSLVVFAADYGDRGHTQQALAIKANVDELPIIESGYSHSGFAVAESDDDPDDDNYNEAQRVLVIT